MSVEFHNKYIQKEFLGSGASAIVHRAQLRNSSNCFAVKIITLSKLDQYNLNLLNREIEINQIMNNKNIVRLVEYFRDQNEMYAVFELCPNGDMRNQILSMAYF